MKKHLIEKTLGTNNIEVIILILKEELRRLRFSINKKNKEVELIEKEINKINLFVEKSNSNPDLP